MAAIPLTRGEIISEGLDVGRNPGLAIRARVFLILFESMLYKRAPLQRFRKEVAGLILGAGSHTTDLSSITDFNFPVSVWYKDRNRPIPLQPYKRFWPELQVRLDQGAQGAPLKATFDPAGDQLIWDRPSDIQREVRILYASQPVIPATTPVNDFDASFPAWPDSWGLVNAVTEFARRWDSHSMLKVAADLAMETIASAKAIEEAAMVHSNAQQMILAPHVNSDFIQD